MEALVNDRLLQDRSTLETGSTSPSPNTSSISVDNMKAKSSPRRTLNVSGPVPTYHPSLKNFWYPVAFSSDLREDTMVSWFYLKQNGNYKKKDIAIYGCLFPFQIPIDCFEEPWVIFRGKDGNPGCVQNTCAHRACPLHLGSVNEGRIQCPYHG